MAKGRKPKDAAEARTHQVNCRLTDAELGELEQRRGGLPPGAWLRLAAFGATIAPPIPEFNREVWSRMAQTSANLNQIARRLNEGGALKNEIEELRQVVASFRKFLISGEE